MTHIIIVNYAYNPTYNSPESLLAHYYALTHWAASVQAAGAKVTVFQRYRQNHDLTQNGVAYHFVADQWGSRLRGWQIPGSLHRRVQGICAEDYAQNSPVLIHVNGLLFPIQVRHLRLALPPESAIVVQHHAEVPWPAAQQWLQRWAFRDVDGFLFTNHDLAEAWLSAKIIPSPEKVYAVMETSSPFELEDRATARRRTGLQGQPVVLWTGNLKPNKDPLTILAGFERVLTQAPGARLYMAYRYGDLLSQVKATIAQSDSLTGAVTLLGAIPHADIAAYYNSADIFVQGSAREGSGIAVLDALACGVAPVITDIPPFRTITAHGEVGRLWPVGDVEGFTSALLAAIGDILPSRPRQIRSFFERHWRFSVLGQKALAVYEEVLSKRVAG